MDDLPYSYPLLAFGLFNYHLIEIKSEQSNCFSRILNEIYFQ